MRPPLQSTTDKKVPTVSRQDQNETESAVKMNVSEFPHGPPKPGVARSNRAGIADFPREANPPEGRNQAVSGGLSPDPVPAKLSRRAAVMRSLVAFSVCPRARAEAVVSLLATALLAPFDARNREALVAHRHALPKACGSFRRSLHGPVKRWPTPTQHQHHQQSSHLPILAASTRTTSTRRNACAVEVAS